VLQHLKGDKVIVSKERRKGYKRETVTDKYLTQIVIEGIGWCKESSLRKQQLKQLQKKLKFKEKGS
jgi:ribosomal protein L24